MSVLLDSMSRQQRLAAGGQWRAFLDSLSDDEALAFAFDWESWARPNQLPPDGMGDRFRVWMFRAGRGSGKTRAGSEACRMMIERTDRIALVAPTAADARDVLVEGDSGIMSVFPVEQRPEYEPSKRRITFHNGAKAYTYSAEEPERLRGPQHGWCFVAGTMVETPDGGKAIELLSVGDLVMTRLGPKKVVATGNRVAEVAHLAHERGALVGTLDHPVMTQRGWTALSLVRPLDMLTLWTGRSLDQEGITGTSREPRFTAAGGYGNRSTARYPKAIRYITSITTAATTVSRTWWRCLLRNTVGFMLPTRTSQRVVTAQNRSNIRDTDRSGTASSVARTENVRATNEQTPNAQGELSRAFNAVMSSRQETETSVVRHVSTGGVLARVYNVTVEDQPEYFANGVLVHNCWIDEPASMPSGEAMLDNLLLGLRLGSAPWAMVTGTPKPLRWLRALADRPDTITTTGSTYENASNLAPGFITDVLGRYEGTRLGRQELHAEWLDDVEGALWTEALLDRTRLATFDVARPWSSLNAWLAAGGQPVLADRRAWRTIVAVDPPGETAECGIVVATAPTQGRAGADHCVVLDDASLAGRPEEWGQQVAAAARRWNADRVYVESNQGGDMTRATIHAVDPNLRVEKITASQSKAARAEPVSALYERGLVHHAGFLPTLEQQMCNWMPGAEKSPDRMDALVHAVSSLLTERPTVAAVVRSPAQRRLPT